MLESFLGYIDQDNLQYILDSIQKIDSSIDQIRPIEELSSFSKLRRDLLLGMHSILSNFKEKLDRLEKTADNDEQRSILEVAKRSIRKNGEDSAVYTAVQDLYRELRKLDEVVAYSKEQLQEVSSKLNRINDEVKVIYSKVESRFVKELENRPGKTKQKRRDEAINLTEADQSYREIASSLEALSNREKYMDLDALISFVENLKNTICDLNKVTYEREEIRSLNDTRAMLLTSVYGTLYDFLNKLNSFTSSHRIDLEDFLKQGKDHLSKNRIDLIGTEIKSFISQIFSKFTEISKGQFNGDNRSIEAFRGEIGTLRSAFTSTYNLLVSEHLREEHGKQEKYTNPEIQVKQAYLDAVSAIISFLSRDNIFDVKSTKEDFKNLQIAAGKIGEFLKIGGSDHNMMHFLDCALELTKRMQGLMHIHIVVTDDFIKRSNLNSDSYALLSKESLEMKDQQLKRKLKIMSNNIILHLNNAPKIFNRQRNVFDFISNECTSLFNLIQEAYIEIATNKNRQDKLSQIKKTETYAEQQTDLDDDELNVDAFTGTANQHHRNNLSTANDGVSSSSSSKYRQSSKLYTNRDFNKSTA